MKKLIAGIFLIFSAASLCFAQGGVYSIIEQREECSNESRGVSTLAETVGDSIKSITIVEYHGGWKDADEAKERIIEVLRDKETEVFPYPLWNMDAPVELVAVIEYTDGSKGKLAVAQHRVGFQDRAGTPWYFQWNARMPR